jgi:hypothetical protein
MCSRASIRTETGGVPRINRGTALQDLGRCSDWIADPESHRAIQHNTGERGATWAFIELD